MKLIKTIGILFLLLSIYSCNVVYFDKPQPIDKKDIKKFPKQFLSEVSFDGAKLLIEKTQLVLIDDEEIQSKILSDSFKLRKSGKNYFINAMDENGWWRVFYVSKKTGRELGVYVINPDDMFLLDKSTLLKEVDSETLEGYEDVAFVEGELWEGGFSSKEINDFIVKGGFSDTLTIIPADSIK